MFRAPRYRTACFPVRASSAGTAVLATKPSPFCHLHSPQAKWACRTLWSRRYATAMLERTESRAPLIPHAYWLLEVPSKNALASVELNEQKLPETWRKPSCGEHPLLGSLFSQQPTLEKSKVSVNPFSACGKRHCAQH